MCVVVVVGGAKVSLETYHDKEGSDKESPVMTNTTAVDVNSLKPQQWGSVQSACVSSRLP